MVWSGRSSAQAITRACILLKVDEGWTAAQVATALDISERTVIRARKRYAQKGLEETLHRRNQANRHSRLGKQVVEQPQPGGKGEQRNQVAGADLGSGLPAPIVRSLTLSSRARPRQVNLAACRKRSSRSGKSSGKCSGSMW